MTRATGTGTSGSTAGAPRGEVTLERLERALAAISYAILLDGPVYAPYLERLEREIAVLRARDDVVSRARQHLEDLPHRGASSGCR